MKVKPKLKDVAIQAGVSLATADRVINNRPGVRQSTRQKVLDAVDELGYQPDPIAASLAKSSVRTIVIILPTEVLGIYQSVVRNWQRVKKNTRYDRVELQLMPYSPLSDRGVNRCLDHAEKTADGVILYALDTPEIHQHTETLSKTGIVIHTFMSGLSGGVVQRFVGFDNYKLGRTVVYLMMLLTGKKSGTVQTHTHFVSAMAHRQTITGKRDFIEEQDWPVDLVVQLDETSSLSCGHIVKQQMETQKDTIGVICLGDECLGDLVTVTNDEKVFDARPKIVLKTMNITASMVDSLLADQIDAIFFMDTAEAMENAIEGMIDTFDRISSGDGYGQSKDKYLDVKLYVKENLPDWCRQLQEEQPLGK